jgi:hypothetical protein
MRAAIAFSLDLMVTVAFATAFTPVARADDRPDPTSTSPVFYKDVLPLLERHCQSCHRSGEAAPMAFLDYQGTRPWAKAMKQAVVTRTMPPWFADPHVGKFSNDRSLPESAIRTIAAWVDAGAPEGIRAGGLQEGRWTDGWTIGKPDIVFEMPTPVTIPLSGTQPYQYVIVPTGFTQDTWVRLAEARAGDRAHTHHIVVSIREPDSPWLRREPMGVPFVSKPGDDGGVGAQGEFLTGYGPGSMPETLAPGQAKLIKAGSDLVFQLHYTANGIAGSDRSRVGLILANEKPRERVLMMAAANVRFVIPPGDPDAIVEARVKLYREATLVSLLPHMHLRGKSFEFRAIYPNGEKETLLSVPRYDFNWQLSYYLDRPKRMPAGTIIEGVAHFDNSPNNPLNPDSSRAVRFGDQNWDEMMIGYFEVAVSPELTARDLLVRPE